MSPLLANIALSVLDDEFTRRWDHEMGTAGKRAWRRDHGKASYRLIRYADDFVIVVKGQQEHAEQLRHEVADVLAPMGLRLSPEKTAWSTSTTGSTSSVSTSDGCGDEAATSGTSTPCPRRRRSPRSDSG